MNQTSLLASAFSFLVLATTASAQDCLLPDVYEPNDSCAAATPLGAGGYFTSTPIGEPFDYYRFEVPAGVTLTCDVYSDDGGGVVDHDLTLFADDCSTVLATAVGSWTEVHLAWENTTGAMATVTLEVEPWTTHQASCANAIMIIGGIANSCTGVVGGDDGLEPDGMSCNDLNEVTDGLYTDLFLRAVWGEDRYRVTVGAGLTLEMDLLFDAQSVGIDGSLYAQCPLLDPPLASSVSTATGEHLVWFNGTGQDTDVYIAVYVSNAAPFAAEGCTLYDMRISRTPNTSAGTPLCFGDGSTTLGGLGVDCPCGNDAAPGEGCANSHGYGAILTGSGSTSVASDDLVLSVTQARRNQPCMLLQGATRIAAPFKDGILCTGNPTHRMEVIFLDSAGAAASVESVVTNGNVFPGQTRYYQAWYRDPFDQAPCNARSNLTQALVIVWN